VIVFPLTIFVDVEVDLKFPEQKKANEKLEYCSHNTHLVKIKFHTTSLTSFMTQDLATTLVEILPRILIGP